jgi:hypothetical protein
MGRRDGRGSFIARVASFEIELGRPQDVASVPARVGVG